MLQPHSLTAVLAEYRDKVDAEITSLEHDLEHLRGTILQERARLNDTQARLASLRNLRDRL